MKATKKIWVSGLSSGIGYLDKLLKWGEEYDMEKLSLEAKKGYIVEKLGFRYTLSYQMPQDLIFAIDYRDHPDDEYFELIKKSGWVHVDSLDYIHLFKAPLGTAPLYTDTATQIEKYTQETRRMGLYSLAAILLLLVISLGITPSLLDYEPINWGWLVILLNGFGLGLVTFTILPFFNYWGRVNQLKKGIRK
jgi:hypothetical protein